MQVSLGERNGDMGGGSMGKVVILTGSMRKDGNTDLLAAAFADGARLYHEVEVLSVADYSVLPCIGCNACFTREGNTCFQNDDMQKLYPKLMEADVIAVASPVYFYGVSASLKAVIDRLHTPMRNRFRVQKLVLLAVAAATIPQVFDAIKMQYRLILDFFHLEDGGSVLVDGVREKGEIAGHPALRVAYRLGSEL